MTDKELKRLRRSDLIDIIYELKKQNQQKTDECQTLQETLKKKELILSNAGSIAVAALELNGVMEAAQAAADQYVLSVEAVNRQAEKTLSEAKAERERILQNANERAEKILEDAKTAADRRWDDFQRKASEMMQTNAELMASLDRNR